MNSTLQPAWHPTHLHSSACICAPSKTIWVWFPLVLLATLVFCNMMAATRTVRVQRNGKANRQAGQPRVRHQAAEFHRPRGRGRVGALAALLGRVEVHSRPRLPGNHQTHRKAGGTGQHLHVQGLFMCWRRAAARQRQRCCRWACRKVCGSLPRLLSILRAQFVRLCSRAGPCS